MHLEREYSQAIHKGIRDLATGNNFSDVTLQIEGKNYSSHKFILSAISPYFSAMFTSKMKEAKKKVIQLPFLNVSTFELLKQFFYTGKNESSPEEALELLEAANFLQIDMLQKDCEDIIKANLNIKNMLNVWRIGKKISLPLEETAFKYICRHLTELIANRSLFDIEKEEISEILNSEYLILLNEDIAAELILSWLAKDFDTRKHYMEYVLPLLRLPFTSAEYLFQRIEKQYPEVTSDDRFQPYLVEAQDYHKFPVRRADFSGKSTRQRPTSVFEDVIILFDGYSNMAALTVDTLTMHKLCPVIRDKGKYFAACTYGDSSIFVSGGMKESRSFLEYSGLTNKWIVHTGFKSSDFVNLTRHTMIGFGNSVYILGGEILNLNKEVKSLFSVHRWDKTVDEWRNAGKLAVSVNDANAVVCNGRIIVVGKSGQLQRGPIQDNLAIIQCYDVTMESTTIINRKSDIIGLESIFGFEKELYVVVDGGICMVNDDLKTLQELGKSPKMINSFGARKIDDRIIFIGNRRLLPDDGLDVWINGGFSFCISTREITDIDSISADFRIKLLQPVCLKIIVKKCFLT